MYPIALTSQTFNVNPFPCVPIEVHFLLFIYSLEHGQFVVASKGECLSPTACEPEVINWEVTKVIQTSSPSLHHGLCCGPLRVRTSSPGKINMNMASGSCELWVSTWASMLNWAVDINSALYFIRITGMASGGYARHWCEHGTLRQEAQGYHQGIMQWHVST